MDSLSLRCLRRVPGLGRGAGRAFVALTLALLASATQVAGAGSQAGGAQDWEATWVELAQKLFDEDWDDADGLEFLLDISGPRVGQGEDRHDWACEVAAPRYYEVVRDDPAHAPGALVEILGIGRAGSVARGDLDLLAWPTLEAARVLADSGASFDALRYIEQARELLPPEHRHQLTLLRRMALLSSERGTFEEALDTLDEVDRMIEQGHAEPDALHANQRDRAAIYLRMGLVDLAAREIGQATRGLEAAHEAGIPVKGPLVNAYCTLTHIYLAQSRFVEVIDESDRLLLAHEDLFGERPGGRATMLFNAALAHELLAYGDAQHLAPARARFEQVVALSAASHEQRARSRMGLARIETRRGQPETALTLLETVRGEAGLSSMTAAELEAAVARAAIARGESRAQLGVRRDQLSQALRSVCDEIAAEAPRAGGIGFLGFRAYRVVLAALIELHLRIDGEAGPGAVLGSLFEGQRLHSLARFVDADGFAVEDVFSQLVPSKGGILVFFPAEEGSHMLAIDANRIVHGSAAGIIEIRNAAAPFVSLIRRSPDGLSAEQRTRRAREFELGSAALFELLIPETIRPLLADWEEVVFVGSDYLRGLPIECLSAPGSSPLGLSKSISHVPSLPLGLHLRESARRLSIAQPAVDLRLVGDAIRGDVARSRYSEQIDFRITSAEREQLSSPFDPERIEFLLGAEATLQGLTDRGRGSSRLLHLITHGIRDDSRELSRGLLLSPTAEHDGFLFGRDVEQLPPSDFIILSSCSSAQGPWRGGDEKTATLVGAFLRAGALGVLSTPSEVELTPTLRLGSSFQRELAHGSTPARGLLRARLDLIGAGFDDPYYWGLVQVTGLGHSAIFSSPVETGRTRGRAYLIAGGALLLMAGIMIKRRAGQRAA